MVVPLRGVISISAGDLVSSTPRKLGFLAGSVLDIAEDFDASLPDMQDQMLEKYDIKRTW